MQMAERICKIFKYLKGENMEKAVINEILQMVADLNAESYRQEKNGKDIPFMFPYMKNALQ